MSVAAIPIEDRSIWPNLPAVSIIVLNYNTREHLEACFSSLYQLVYPDQKLELILVDNASTDQSSDYIQTNFAQVTLVKNDQNYGFGGGNNRGAQQASGEWVAFLNPDMRVDRRWLIEMVKPLLADSEVTAASSKILSWDGQKIDFAGGGANFYGYGYQIGVGQDASRAAAQIKPILFACGGAMIVRRQAFLEAGGFDEDFFSYYEDVDLGWRLWVLGHKVIFVPEAVAYHHHHGSWGKVSEEKRRILYERNAFLTIVKNYEEANLNKILPAAFLLLLRRIYLATGVDENLFRPAAGSPKEKRASPSLETELQPGNDSYGPAYYLRETWRTLTGEGVEALYLKFKAELTRRRRDKQRAQKPGPMQINKNSPDRATIPGQALSYIVAGNDIVMLYEKMLAKREAIQARRRRSDQEIMKLFERPLGFSELWPEYKQTQIHLSHLFEIDKLFAA